MKSPMSVGQRRRRRAASLIFAVAAVVAFVFLLNGLAVIRQMRDLEAQWRNQTTIAQERGAHLFHLQNALGYGGFIDNFKTFILQGDLEALDAATEHLARAELELDLLADGGLADAHPDLIERLRFVIKAYQVRLVMADDAFSEGYSSNEIANLVTVEDEPALVALRALSQEVHANMEAVQEETRRRLDEAVGLARLGLLILPLIAIVAWLLVRFLRDMTAANERANLAASRVEAIIASSPEAMIVVDAAGTIVRANTAAGRLLGYEPSRLVGMPASTLTPAAGRGSDDALAQLIGASGSPVVVGRQTWIAKRSGDRLPVDISASVTGDDQDALVTMLIRDATLRRDYEQGLIEARQAAERASNAKSEFLANVSHEVRTPINAIIGLSGLLQKTPLSDQQSDYVSKLHSAGRRLLDLVNDMLDFARIDAGRMEIELSPFDPRELIDQVATVAAVHAEAKNLDLIFRVSRALPQMAIGDENRLGQILSNLVSNAIKFTNEGSVVVEADAEALVKGSAVLRFAVRDTGIGIPAAQLDQLFEAFTQADTSAARKHGGAGLGLAICQSLVEAMGGVISAESKVGEGSVFRFSVTVQVPADTTIGPPRILPALDPTTFPILVADDNEAVREVLREELSALDFPVTVVDGGSRAVDEMLARCRTPSPYSLMLVDWQMPDMDGVQVVRRVADTLDADKMPVTILITSFDSTEARSIAEGLPIDAFLEKPVNTSTLIDNLMEALASRRRGEAGDLRRSERVARVAALDSGGAGNALMAHAVGARVLIVDDNAINQQVAKELLAEIGAVTELAESGQQAIDILSAHDPDYFDLVLMDIQMPVMDGISTTEKLRADDRYDKLPIVALTAHALGEERDRCFRAGMDGHISKPVTVQQLIETLNAWVGSGRADREAIYEAETGEPEVADTSLQSRDIETMPLFDPGRVATLKSLSEGFLEQMLRDFSSRYHGAAQEIRALLERNDFEQAKNLAHTIKGTSGSLGAERLFGVARQLDEALKDPRDNELIERLAGIFEETLVLTLSSIEQDYGAN